MNQESVATTFPVDPGCLPAWEVDELPEAPPVEWRNVVRLIGPGLVMAGGAIGTGEWVMGPQAAAKYHGALMWVVLASIIAQVVLNTEVMRYTICTGEPIMTGFMRSKPGPKFWLPFYILLDFGSWWPALAGLAAQIIVVAVQGLTPHDTINQDTVRNASYVVFLVCAIMVLFGGKIYNTLEFVLGSKVFFVLFYLVIADLFFVSMKTWGEIWSGLINPFNVPHDAAGNVTINWGLISALAGYAGVGGMGNIMASNFVREKGWGMGSKVGAIPSAFGGHEITLSHIGTMCRPGPETTRRFKNWIKQLGPDQYLVWFLGSLFGMMLPCMLGAQFLHLDDLGGNEKWRWAASLAQRFGEAHGQIFRILTLTCGLVILVPGQFSVVDGISRRWCDAVWSGVQSMRRLDTHKVKYVYYAFAAAYVTWGVCALTFFSGRFRLGGWLLPDLSASAMMQISGNMANLAIATTILHTLYVNRRFLPRELRPSRGKQVALVCSALFFLTMFGLVVNEQIVPIVRRWFG